MAKPDLLAEHAALLRQQAELQAVCRREFATMSTQTASLRAQRLGKIGDRLKAIEKSKSWQRTHACAAGPVQVDLIDLVEPGDG